MKTKRYDHMVDLERYCLIIKKERQLQRDFFWRQLMWLIFNDNIIWERIKKNQETSFSKMYLKNMYEESKFN